VWYEQERTPNHFQRGNRCTHARYSYLNESAIAVENRGINSYEINPYFTDINFNFWNKKKLRATNEGTLSRAVATVPNPNEPNKLAVVFPPSTRAGSYEVWTTDYERYSVVYACTQNIPLLAKTEYVWILSKSPVLDSSFVQLLKSELDNKGVNVERFMKTDQKNCIYFA
jgi:lipocalin